MFLLFSLGSSYVITRMTMMATHPTTHECASRACCLHLRSMVLLCIWEPLPVWFYPICMGSCIQVKDQKMGGPPPHQNMGLCDAFHVCQRWQHYCSCPLLQHFSYASHLLLHHMPQLVHVSRIDNRTQEDGSPFLHQTTSQAKPSWNMPGFSVPARPGACHILLS
jgi:hypothetical protein